MGGIIGTTEAKKFEVVVLEEKDDDRIVLVEQMWKHKRDLSRYLGIRHAFVVTTTAKGKKTKRDIILDPKKRVSTRKVDYKPSSDPEFVWNRVKVAPTFTEEELSTRLSKYSNQYDITENNCWHYSHLVTSALNAKTDPHPYLLLIKGLSSFMSPFIDHNDFKSFSKSFSEFLVN